VVGPLHKNGEVIVRTQGKGETDRWSRYVRKLTKEPIDRPGIKTRLNLDHIPEIRIECLIAIHERQSAIQPAIYELPSKSDGCCRYPC
jgi:hypothetical protein